MAQLQAVRAGTDAAQLPASCRYLAAWAAAPNARCPAQGQAALAEPAALQALLDHRAGRLVGAVGAQLAAGMAAGQSEHAAWRGALVEVAHASRAHCQAVLFRAFAHCVATGEAGGTPPREDPAARAALGRLCGLHGLCAVQGELGDWLEDGHLDGAQAAALHAAVRALLAGPLADDAVALVDAWDLHDRQLQSTLGRWDGQVYPAVLAMAERSPLNALAAPRYRAALAKL